MKGYFFRFSRNCIRFGEAEIRKKSPKNTDHAYVRKIVERITVSYFSTDWVFSCGFQR